MQRDETKIKIENSLTERERERGRAQAFISSWEENEQCNRAADPDSSNGRHLLGDNNETLSDIDSDDVSIAVERLEHLLSEQKKELDELKRKHEMTVSDLLKKKTPEFRHKVLSICNLKIPDYKEHCQMHCDDGNSANEESFL